VDLDQLQAVVHNVLVQLHCDAQIPLEAVVIERPREREHGDWATNAAMKFSKALGYSNPRQLAEVLAVELEKSEAIAKVTVAGPGFVNIVLNNAASASVVNAVLQSGKQYGQQDVYHNLKINLEFVSANPTGPLHIGGVRWAAVGDALARILEFSGAVVEREYYFNDHGAQIDRFANSLYAAANSLPTPEDGYAGAYINEIAAEVVQLVRANNNNQNGNEAPTLEDFRSYGVQIMFPSIKQSLVDFGVQFDRFFHEQSLYDDGKVDAALEQLRERGAVYEQDGATWIATSQYGDDKDRVVLKSNGEYAYFAADIAYYLDKRKRADKAVYMLGADHGGYVGRLKAVAAAFGDVPDENIVVMIGQLVNLVKDGQPVRMSKRAGNIITIDDLVDAIGVDAARFALVRSSTDTMLELDLDLLQSHKMDNPVYYVQYAYARTCNVLRNFQAVYGDLPLTSEVDLGQLADETEAEVLACLTQFGQVVKTAATTLEPHRVARYLEALAASYHQWYAKCRVVGEQIAPELSRARILLNQAVAQVLLNGLTLVGVSAPEKM
jgi:arginyl-tRNA synthetase